METGLRSVGCCWDCRESLSVFILCLEGGMTRGRPKLWVAEKQHSLRSQGGRWSRGCGTMFGHFCGLDDVHIFFLWSVKKMTGLVLVLICHDQSGLAQCRCSVTSFMSSRGTPGQLIVPGQFPDVTAASFFLVILGKLLDIFELQFPHL